MAIETLQGTNHFGQRDKLSEFHLIHLPHLQEGYFDCQMAIEHGYPEEKLLKLLQRKKSLAVACKNQEYVDESIDALVELMRNSNMAPEEIEKGMLILY